MPKLSKQKPTVNIIGLGRLGSALAIALARKRYRIETLVSRKRVTLEKAAALVLDANVRLLVAKDLDQLQPAQLTLITTPDDQLPQVVKGLSKVKSPGSVVLHTSGALSSKALSPLEDLSWHTGSLHPLVSVSGAETANVFRGAFWCVEGDQRALKAARELVRDLNGHSFSIRAEVKALYHAAAVMTSGNVTALFDVAVDMLEKCGLSRAEAQKILLPLLESTVENLTTRAPSKALTGTFSRGDVGTVERHLEALSAANLNLAHSLYRLLGLKSLKLAEENGLDPALNKKIRRLLKR